MKASVILAHPYSKSFNHAIYNTVCSKLESLNVTTYKHDLYSEEFDPVLSVQELGSDSSTDPLVNQYAVELMAPDFLFFIHPNWWGQPPAILKGYIDRVIRPPYAYDFPENDSGGGLPIGKLKRKCCIVFNTANTGEEREENYFEDPLDKIWKKCICGFCGIEKYYRKVFSIVVDSNTEQRKAWLLETEKFVEDVINSTTK